MVVPVGTPGVRGLRACMQFHAVSCSFMTLYLGSSQELAALVSNAHVLTISEKWQVNNNNSPKYKEQKFNYVKAFIVDA